MSEYGRIFPQLRNSCPHWSAYTRHAFVEGLGTGSLAQEQFLHYLKQDYVFLVHFSRAWALAVVKADTLSEMKFATQTLDGLVNHEMQLHVETCKGYGISEEDLFNTQEAVQNLAYTRYVLEAGQSGDFLDLMAALAPCVLGYGEIGARLLNDLKKDTPYHDWIRTYGGQEYQDICHGVGQLLDEAVASRLGAQAETLPKWQKLQSHFNTATRLEVDFWGMGLQASRIRD